jgi:hypothetical protein
MRARQPDRMWWTDGTFNRRPMPLVLRERDFTTVFCFLRAHGWSSSAIAAATGLSENRVRAISKGQQRITSYDVLERVAAGLCIERGLVGLAYTDAGECRHRCCVSGLAGTTGAFHAIAYG